MEEHWLVLLARAILRIGSPTNSHMKVHLVTVSYERAVAPPEGKEAMPNHTKSMCQQVCSCITSLWRRQLKLRLCSSGKRGTFRYGRKLSWVQKMVKKKMRCLNPHYSFLATHLTKKRTILDLSLELNSQGIDEGKTLSESESCSVVSNSL